MQVCVFVWERGAGGGGGDVGGGGVLRNKQKQLYANEYTNKMVPKLGKE